ncbi:MAG TPA: iron ABC transporter permease [Pseudidiomarina sp.]|nr:iron ABC transporter permease [Pseudidiomarina sp.]
MNKNQLQSRALLYVAFVFFTLLFAVLHLGSGDSHWWIWPTSELDLQILYDIRWPRLNLVLLNGFALGLAGAAIQIIFRNPLAEPGIIGISSGAALVVVSALYFGWMLPTAWSLPLIGMMGALGAFGLLWILAGRSLQTIRLLLAGVAISALGGALLALILSLAPNPFAFQEWTLWLMGSVANRGWEHVTLMLPSTVLATLIFFSQRRFIGAHVFASSQFAVLGFHYQRAQAAVLLGLTLLVGASVVSAGMIGFIGLIAPHIVRLMGIQQPRTLLWWSAAMGGSCLIAVDTLVMWLPTRQELPLGVITALLGAPILLYLLHRFAAREAGHA